MIDLSPLSYIAGTLIGNPTIRVFDGPNKFGARAILPSNIALASHGVEPIPLASKEHLGILNGTDVVDFDRKVTESTTYGRQQRVPTLAESKQKETYSGGAGAGQASGVVGPDGEGEGGDLLHHSPFGQVPLVSRTAKNPPLKSENQICLRGRSKAGAAMAYPPVASGWL